MVTIPKEPIETLLDGNLFSCFKQCNYDGDMVEVTHIDNQVVVISKNDDLWICTYYGISPRELFMVLLGLRFVTKDILLGMDFNEVGLTNNGEGND